MKRFQGFQQVTGGGPQRGPGGGAGGGNNPYANTASRGGGGQNRGNNRNKPKNRNKGGGGAGAPPVEPPVTPTPQASTTPITDANTPGAISTLATDKPLDYFSGLLSGQGQMNAGGPSVYQNWQQNQAFNDIYSKHMAQFQADPLNAPAFDQYLTNTYGPGSVGLAPALQRQFNLLTPTQRGDFNNVFNNATGRTQFWG